MSNSTLKIIAVIAMLIDHIGAFLFPELRLLRYIGRIAFPIFVFLLVEGYGRSRSVPKYLARLFVFALISELPFNLAHINGGLFYLRGQNVYFTLFLGLLCIFAMDMVSSGDFLLNLKKYGIRSALKSDYRNSGCEFCLSESQKLGKILIKLAVYLPIACIAELMNTDYGAGGVTLIVIFYYLGRQELIRDILGAGIFALCYSPIELFACLSFIPIHFYNGKRGLKMKYFFYAFYPVHLLLIYFVRRLLV